LILRVLITRIARKPQEKKREDHNGGEKRRYEKKSKA
jgi:hypothetical protein